MMALPPNAIKYMPAVVEQAALVAPAIQPVELFAGQIEQESCVSLKSKGCWNPNTELKTSREYGFGLGQLTVAYKQDGSERFNAFKEVRTLDSKLKAWQWQNRFDASFQIRAIMVKDWQAFKLAGQGAATSFDANAMMLAAYNGGIGGVLSDRKLCQAQTWCDSSRWWGNTEKTSLKSRMKWQGYGKSAFDINREYPQNVLNVRMHKYHDLVKHLTSQR